MDYCCSKLALIERRTRRNGDRLEVVESEVRNVSGRVRKSYSLEVKKTRLSEI